MSLTTEEMDTLKLLLKQIRFDYKQDLIIDGIVTVTENVFIPADGNEHDRQNLHQITNDKTNKDGICLTLLRYWQNLSASYRQRQLGDLVLLKWVTK